MSQKNQKKAKSAQKIEKVEENYIQIGNVKLSNVDLQNIVRKSEEIPALENDPKFMKSLDEYAEKKSLEIIDSTLQNKKPTKIDKNLVNPAGLGSPFFKKPTQELKIDESFRLVGKLQPLELSQLFFKSTLEIAQQLLHPSFPYTFQYTLDVFFGITGIVRQCTFNFVGQDSFEVANSLFKHKFCNSQNFQWFYTNHYGRLMEIHDTMSLKQALVNFGAFPRGTCDPSRETAKILCVPRCVQTEDEIFDRECDLIMGYNNVLHKHGAAYLQHLPFLLAPDHRFFKIFHVAVIYSEQEKRREYNDYEEIGHLISYCQRKMDSVEECFEDERNRNQSLSTNDLYRLLDNRFANPYKHYNRVESANLEAKSVLEMLKKSKFQTSEDLQWVELVMRDRIKRFKA